MQQIRAFSQTAGRRRSPRGLGATFFAMVWRAVVGQRGVQDGSGGFYSKTFLASRNVWTRGRALVSPGEPPCTGAGGWRRGGACGAIPPEGRGSGGRTGAGGIASALESVCSLPRTPPGLHYDRAVASHLKARRVLTALRLSRRAGPVRTETAAWDARELASYLHMSWRPGVPLPSSQDETRFLNSSAEPTSRHARGAMTRACSPLPCHGRPRT